MNGGRRSAKRPIWEAFAPDSACFLGVPFEFPGFRMYPARQQERNIYLPLDSRRNPRAGTGTIPAEGAVLSPWETAAKARRCGLVPRCRKHRISFLALFVLLVPGAPLSPQVPTDTVGITVDGRVVDRLTARAVENAVIRVPELGLHVLSDSTGHFQLRSIRPGVFQMTVSCTGYREEEGEFTVLRGGSFEITLSPMEVGPDAEPGRILGRVSAPETGDPIPDAEVVLADVGLRRATSRTGWFEFPEIPPGVHVLRVSFLGRETREDTVFLGEDQLLEVDIHLPIEPIHVEGITVTAYPRWLIASGFFRRRGRNYEGRQWARDELEEINPMFLGDLIETIPGVRRVGLNGGYFGRGRKRCRLTVFVDDVEMEDWFSLDQLDPLNVEALEVYHGDGKPGEFFWYCGVILVWLKH